ncbi:hypothetical protein DFJ74DRAFT_705715 [Hyaloraphidium curvatum]|nr:hypothetical protein DFJ74DRAFT_705715 [Hyaloraphidium curvatum]
MEVDEGPPAPHGGYAIFLVGATKLAAHTSALAASPVLAAAVAADPHATLALPPCFGPPALAALLAFLHTGAYSPPSPAAPHAAHFAAGADPAAWGSSPQQGLTPEQQKSNKALGFSLPQLASHVASPPALIELFALCSAYGVEQLKPAVAKDVVAVLSPDTAAEMLRKARECAAVVPPESGFGAILETVERYIRTKMGADPEALLNPPHANGGAGEAQTAKREIKEIRRKRVKE